MLPEEIPFFANGREPVRDPPIASASFTYTSERDGVGASLVVRLLAGAMAFLAAITMALTPVPATAVELPGCERVLVPDDRTEREPQHRAAGTRRPPPAPATTTSRSRCRAAGRPPPSIYVDLFSPEMNRVAGASPLSEEPAGNYDSTQYELYGPGATVGPGFASPAPGAGIAGTRVTYQPGAAGVAEAWIRYATLTRPRRLRLLRRALAGARGRSREPRWHRRRSERLEDPGRHRQRRHADERPARQLRQPGRRGRNERRDPPGHRAVVSTSTTPPDSQCQTFYEYTNPGQASVTFNNFDMDAGTSRVRYYAAGDAAYVATGVSGGTLGTTSGRRSLEQRRNPRRPASATRSRTRRRAGGGSCRARPPTTASSRRASSGRRSSTRSRPPRA